MDIHLGSIMKRFYDVHPMSVYVRDLKQGFKRPSFYFPVPDSNEYNGGLNFEFAEHILKVTVFHDTAAEAVDILTRIKRDLLDTRKTVEFVDEEGTLQGAFFHVSNIQIRSDEIDNTGTLTLNYTTEEVYGRPDYTPAEYANITSEVVEHGRE